MMEFLKRLNQGFMLFTNLSLLIRPPNSAIILLNHLYFRFCFTSQLWFYSSTAGYRHLLLKPFERANSDSDIEDIIHPRVVHTAEDFYDDQDHILNPCYTRG